MIHRTQSEHIHSILKNALAQIEESSARRVKEVRFALGEIAEVGQQAISSYWVEFSKGTPAESAQLRFRLITAEVQCMACFRKYHPEGGVIHCPHCGSFGAKILSGEEFYFESIE